MTDPARLSAYALTLRALVHRNLGELPPEPRLDRKQLLAAHSYEDARAVAKLLRRLRELPDTEELPGAPGPALQEALDAGPHPAALAQAIRAHLSELDPIAEELDVRVLTQIAQRQERHGEELPRGDWEPLILEVRRGSWTPGSQRAPDAPARDPWIETGANGSGLHADLNAAILAAEVAAQTSHDQPKAPWGFHVDCARIAADRMREAAVLDARLVSLGEQWGDRPVDLSAFTRALAGGTAERLAFAAAPGDIAHQRIAERWR